MTNSNLFRSIQSKPVKRTVYKEKPEEAEIRKIFYMIENTRRERKQKMIPTRGIEPRPPRT
jgi:hypothetical protein